MPSQIKVDQIAGASGNTVTVPSGQTLDISSATLSLPSTVVTTTGTQTLTNKTIGVSQLTGTLPVANGGTGLTSLGSASQVLRVNSGATALEFATAPSGKVLQVVSATKTATQTITGAAENNPEEWNSIGLSASITPASVSNKILILVSVVGGATNNAFMSIFRGTSATSIGNTISNTNLAVPDSPGSRQPSFSGDFHHPSQLSIAITQPVIFLDSPSTTSARVYEVGVSIHSTATLHINRADNDTNAGWQIRGVSTITLMEIAG